MMPTEGTPHAQEKALIPGEVLTREGGGGQVRLETGEIGRLPDDSSRAELHVGQRMLFRIERRDSEGRPIVSLAPSEEQAGSQAFDQAVHRLHTALANHRPSNTHHRVERNSLDEERIERWIGDVEKTLSRLRQRRTRRLNDQI
jgi:hypothetical protein